MPAECTCIHILYFQIASQLNHGLSSVSALNIVYQRNGDGEAKSPACRAGVCEAVLHTLKQGSRFPAQVISEMGCLRL